MQINLAGMNAKAAINYKNLVPYRDIHALRAFSHLNYDDRLLRSTHRSNCASLDFDSGTYYLNNNDGYPLELEGMTRKKFTFNDYLNYLKYYRNNYSRVFNFDCDFSNEGFDTNIFYQKRLEDAGLDPIPVVHSIDGYEIDYYIEQGYENVALGSPQITNFGTLSYVMNKFMGTKIKVHLFGNTTFDYLSEFPIYSCDSSVWAQAARFGEIVWWNPFKYNPNKTDRVYLEEYYHNELKSKPISTYRYRSELMTYLNNELGVTMNDLLGPEGSLFKQLVNIHHYLHLQDILNKIHQKKGFWTAE